LSISAAHAAAFYTEVAEQGAVWTVRDRDGYPAPANADGKPAQPFWSSRTRAERITSTVPAYAHFEVVEISWEAFRSRWVPGLDRDGMVGVNWSGLRATGYDVSASEVLRSVESLASAD
jgi:hypothetical protein